MTRSFVALGSNLGDSLQTLRRARESIDRIPDTRVSGQSAIYRSAAVGPGNQADYLNAVLSVETDVAAGPLLQSLLQIEDGAGRERHERWEARTLDLDLLLYGMEVHRSASLEVPHPRMFERNFVLQPLCDLCPDDFRFPDGSQLGERCRACPPNPIERTSLKWEAEEAGDADD